VTSVGVKYLFDTLIGLSMFQVSQSVSQSVSLVSYFIFSSYNSHI